MEKTELKVGTSLYNMKIISETKKNMEAKWGQYLYKGNHKSGVISGKGVLYFKGDKFLEGEWKNGKIVKGKEYKNKNLIYQGQFKNNLYHGKGIEYVHDPDTSLDFDEKYIGDFKNGEQTGIGEKWIYYNGPDDFEKLEGHFKKGKLNGQGKLFYGNQIWKEGNFKNGFLNGKGKSYSTEISENPKLVYEGQFKNDYFEGKGTFYDKYGHYYIGTFKHDMKEGKGKEYYPNGLLEAEGTYKKNRKNGSFTIYYDNSENSIQFKGIFKNDFKRGKGVSYYPNGNKEYVGVFNMGFKKGKKYNQYNPELYEEGKFEFGKLNGPGKIYYNPGGTLSEKGTYDGGYRKGLMYIYHKNGKLAEKVYYENGYMKGDGIIYWENGNVREKGTFRTSSLTGRAVRYFENGNIHEKGTFEYGYLKEGTKYSETGEYITGSFRDRNPNGKCIEYWSNKKKRSIGVWDEGKKEGLFSIYHENGKLAFKGHFKNNLKMGKGAEYDQNGTLIKKGYWSEGIYVGTKKAPTAKQIEKKERNDENNIKKYMQTNNTGFLKGIKTEHVKKYLKKYAKKQVHVKTKKAVLKELQKWRKELKQEKKKQHTVPMVYDVLQSEDVSVSDFLKNKNRIVLTEDGKHFAGGYLDHAEIFYECHVPQISFHEYVGNPNVRGLVRITTDQGNYYFQKTDSILKDMRHGFNLFHFNTEPKDVKILSKKVALGASIMSGNHCDPKDLIKISKSTKREKIGTGLKTSIEFIF